MDLSPTVTATETPAYSLLAENADMCSDMNTSRSASPRWAALAAALLCFAAPGRRAVQTARRRRSGDRREIPHRRRRRFLVPDRRHRRRRASSSASRARRSTLKRDLGLTDQRLPALQLQLRPARSHKFRLDYIPVNYTQTHDAEPGHRVQRHPLPPRPAGELDARLEDATSSATSSTSSSKNWGFVGFDLEAKYTDVQVSARQPDRQRVRARARPDSGDRRHRRATTSCRTSRSPARSPPSRSRTASTAATTRTTSTSTSTAR